MFAQRQGDAGRVDKPCQYVCGKMSYICICTVLTVAMLFLHADCYNIRLSTAFEPLECVGGRDIKLLQNNDLRVRCALHYGILLNFCLSECTALLGYTLSHLHRRTSL
jgi:hypothetical protein